MGVINGTKIDNFICKISLYLASLCKTYDLKLIYTVDSSLIIEIGLEYICIVGLWAYFYLYYNLNSGRVSCIYGVRIKSKSLPSFTSCYDDSTCIGRACTCEIGWRAREHDLFHCRVYFVGFVCIT